MRLARTRSAASGACRAGHVRVNGVRVKPAHAVRPGDEVRLRYEGRERVVVVQRVITKRVGAPVAAGCYIDNSPPPPPREEAVAVAARRSVSGSSPAMLVSATGARRASTKSKIRTKAITRTHCNSAEEARVRRRRDHGLLVTSEFS